MDYIKNRVDLLAMGTPLKDEVLNMLIMDDNASSINATCTKFKSKFTFSFCMNEDDLNRILSTERVFDCILMDIHMPNKNGLEMCVEIKKIDFYANTPFLFLSACDDPEVIAHSFSVGGYDFVNKNMPSRELEIRIRKHVETQRKINFYRDMSIKDPLTKLYNRNGMIENMEREITRANRYALPISAMLIDLDNFKTINDTYGHDVGDQCLITLSSVLSSFARRPGDFACRIGGDEFFLFFAHCDKEGINKVGAALLNAISECTITTTNNNVDSVINISCSIGTVTETPTYKEIDKLMKKADIALYQAKMHGKNRMHIHTQS